MNYITHLNTYRLRRLQNPLSTNAIALYFILLEYSNTIGWPERFTVANTMMQGLSGLSRNALHIARNELIQRGYIAYKKGVGNQCGTYLIVRFNTQIDTQSDTQNDTQTQHSLGTLYKPNQTKPNEEEVPPQKNPPIPYEKIRAEYNRLCVDFPKCTKLSDKRKEAIAARVHSGYSFEDFVRLFEIAQASDFLKGKNKNNWRADFDWLICDSNMAKALDGRYVNREPAQQGNAAYSQEDSDNIFFNMLRQEGKL